MPEETKPFHHQSIQNVLPDEVVNKVLNASLTAESIKRTDDPELAQKLQEKIAFAKEIRTYEDQGILTTNEAIEIVASHNASTEDKLEKQLLTDDITGKLNQTGYKVELARALSRGRRTGEKVVVAFGDLEGFKGVNDVLGHKAGDDALRIVAMFFEAELRTEDFIARFGGDEFGFGFIGADLEKIKERLLTIRDEDLPETVKTALKSMGVDGEVPRVTISLGFYEANPDDSVDDVMKAADQAMYEDKRARNPEGKR